MEAATTAQKLIISVAWPYANGDLHLGHLTGCFLPATVFNDFNRLKGNDVIMISGSDMHGTPVAVKAWKEGVAPRDYALRQHQRHVSLLKMLGMEYSLYTSTTTKLHARVVQQLFTILLESKYIFKQKTAQFWSETEKKFLLDRYIEGKCPHCGFEKARGDQCDNCGNTLTPDELINPYSIFGDKVLQKRESTNYYLDLPKLQPYLEKFYAQHPYKDHWRKHVWNTTQGWLENGLEPRAITRDMEGYGVALPIAAEVPGEDGKVIYVWFEAVSGYFTAAVELAARQVNPSSTAAVTKSSLPQLMQPVAEALKAYQAEKHDYIESTYPGQSLQWQDYWLDPDTKSYYFLGKDNIPFHTLIWPAMLEGINLAMADTARLVLPWDVPANQYLNLRGGKFSKSTGNMIYAEYLLKNYSHDTVRYYLISRMPETKDYDFTWEEFVEANNSELVANLGNFINRTLVFWNKNQAAWNEATKAEPKIEVLAEVVKAFNEVGQSLENTRFGEALGRVMQLSSFANKYFNDTQVWQLIKTDPGHAYAVIQNQIYLVANLGLLIRPFLPDLSNSIYQYLNLELPKLKVTTNHWQPISMESLAIAGLGEIADLLPLVTKLDWETVKLKENLSEA